MFLDLYCFFVACYKSLESLDGAVEVVLDGTFPDGSHAKALQRKFPVGFDVAYHVVREFLVPEFRIALGAARELATMLVPKASVYKNDYAMLENEQVGRSRQVMTV